MTYKEIIDITKDIIKILKMDEAWGQVKGYQLAREDIVKAENDFLRALKQTNNDK